MTAALEPLTRLARSARASNRPLPAAAVRTVETLVRRAIPPLSTPLVRLGDYQALAVADLKLPIGLKLLRYGFHDPVAWAVHRLLARGDCFIDAGANIGLITLVGAARVGSIGRVISCEPSASTAELLRRNLNANEFSWVTVAQVAVSDNSGMAELIEFGAGAGLNSFAPETREGGRVAHVRVTRLDDLAAALPAVPVLVKLDIEGAEVKAMLGAPELLAARRTSFVIEVEPEHLERQGATVGQLEELFAGYEPHTVIARGPSFDLVPWRGAWDALPSPNLVLTPIRKARGEVNALTRSSLCGADQPATVSVVVTTYRRVEELAACLEGLRFQTRPPEEVVVVMHSSDEESGRLVERLAEAWPQLRCERIDERGSVAALNHGLAAARGEVVAITDDDAVPNSDWLERIMSVFGEDDRIAAVGGRDIIVEGGRVVGPRRRRIRGQATHSPTVGRIQVFGRMIANHHLGAGEARAVDVLKGANMSVRRKAAGHGYDERLRGHGAIVHTELSICLPLRRRGLRVVYDPNIVVLHYPAPRPAGDNRVAPSREAVFWSAHNEALEILDYLGPLRRVAYSVWGVAIGSTDAPGLAVLARDVLTGRPAASLRFVAAQRGRAAARTTRRVPRPVPAGLSARVADPDRRSVTVP